MAVVARNNKIQWNNHLVKKRGGYARKGYHEGDSETQLLHLYMSFMLFWLKIRVKMVGDWPSDFI